MAIAVGQLSRQGIVIRRAGRGAEVGVGVVMRSIAFRTSIPYQMQIRTVRRQRDRKDRWL